MDRPSVLRKIAAFGVLAVAVSAPSANASGSSALRSNAASATAYDQRDVVRAFSSVKIKLVTTAAGNESQFVTALTAVASKKLTHTKPWAVAVWVYENENLARQAFTSGSPQWHANGLAFTRVGNIVVTVVPKGREIGAEGPKFPMPTLVRHALRALKHV